MSDEKEAADPTARLLSLRSRVLRARQQATLLKPELPTLDEELRRLEYLLIAAWRVVSDIIDVVMPEGANDTPEEILAEQKAIATELRRMAGRDSMKGLLDPDDPDYF